MVGFVLSFFVILLILAGIIGAASSSAMFGDKKVEVKDNSILYLDFKEVVVDRAEKKPFNINFGGFNDEKKLGLNQYKEILEEAAKDDRIKGIVFEFNGVNGGMATMHELRSLFEQFKESGKFVVSYSEVLSQGGYYMASVADEVYLNPKGELLFKGFASSKMFFKGMLDKLEVEAQIIRGKNNQFKSAVEPFMYTQRTEADKEQTRIYMNGFWNTYLQTISNARNISVDELKRIANEFEIRNADDALALNFVDGLKYKDEILSLIKEKLELEESKDIDAVSASDYLAALDFDVKKEDGEKSDLLIKNKVAVIYAAGDITSGDGSEGIQSEYIARTIRKARRDTTVKAIVLRVNSPGGSALASEVIWRETQLAKAEKPFVVSMGDLAASGGYYISCGADKIYANPNTITGSIGVFGIIPNIKGMLNNKLGITVDPVKTSEFADYMELTRPLTDAEYAIVQQSVDEVYDTFTGRVAEGRGLAQAYVDSIGQGRVWTGTNALELGLVDELGDLQDAIDYAVAMAEIDEYKVEELPKVKDEFQELLKELKGEAYQSYFEAKFGEWAAYFEKVQTISKYSGIQARLPYEITIK